VNSNLASARLLIYLTKINENGNLPESGNALAAGISKRKRIGPAAGALRLAFTKRISGCHRLCQCLMRGIRFHVQCHFCFFGTRIAEVGLIRVHIGVQK
jgi:hypothetical protein